jgi:death-on-curing protein
MQPQFLTHEEVLAIHRDQIERYGGSLGLRDEGMLRSALAMPSAGIGGEYFHSDLQEMAAAYLFHLAQNHPFVDGNKRVAAVAAFVFLWLNGYELTADEATYERIVRDAASGVASKAQLSEFFRVHARARPGSKRRGR